MIYGEVQSYNRHSQCLNNALMQQKCQLPGLLTFTYLMSSFDFRIWTITPNLNNHIRSCHATKYSSRKIKTNIWYFCFLYWCYLIFCMHWTFCLPLLILIVINVKQARFTIWCAFFLSPFSFILSHLLSLINRRLLHWRRNMSNAHTQL